MGQWTFSVPCAVESRCNRSVLRPGKRRDALRAISRRHKICSPTSPTPPRTDYHCPLPRPRRPEHSAIHSGQGEADRATGGAEAGHHPPSHHGPDRCPHRSALPAYKPSGVEWLGDVPAHWEVSALRLRYSQCLGKMLDTKRIKGNYLLPYLRNIDVHGIRLTSIIFQRWIFPPADYGRYTVQQGDLLVCEGGEVGRCAIWSRELPVCGFQKALHRLRPRKVRRDLTRFLHYALRAAVQGNAFNDGHLSTIAHLTGEKLRAHRFSFPPLPEQETLARFLDTQLTKIDRAISGVRCQIDLLREYRTRLISDVVTGKLDVRDAAAALPEEPGAPLAPEGECARPGGRDEGRTSPIRRMEFPAPQKEDDCMTDWKTCPAVERNPRKISGAWAFAGTRVPLYALFENLGHRRHGRRSSSSGSPVWTSSRFSRCSITRQARSGRKRRVEAAIRSGNAGATTEPPPGALRGHVGGRRAGRTRTTASCSTSQNARGTRFFVTTDQKSSLPAETWRAGNSSSSCCSPRPGRRFVSARAKSAGRSRRRAPERSSRCPSGSSDVVTDTTEQGLERLICTALAGHPCDPPPVQSAKPNRQPAHGGVGWSGGSHRDYDREHCVDLAQLAAFPPRDPAGGCRGPGPGRGRADAPQVPCPAARRDLQAWHHRGAAPRHQARRARPGALLRHAVARQRAGQRALRAEPLHGHPAASLQPRRDAAGARHRALHQRPAGRHLRAQEQPHETDRADDAVEQYRKDRNPREKLFELGRCVAHFAVDEGRGALLHPPQGQGGPGSCPSTAAGTTAPAIRPTPAGSRPTICGARC